MHMISPPGGDTTLLHSTGRLEIRVMSELYDTLERYRKRHVIGPTINSTNHRSIWIFLGISSHSLVFQSPRHW